MADKYLNKTVLEYWYNRMKTVFAKQTDLDALDTKVDGIIAEGGEPNVIETVKVNGTALTPDSEKAVSLYGATQEQTSRWYVRDYRDGDKILEIKASNNGVDFLSTSNGFDQNDWVKSLVDKTYVDDNGGKIDKIKVNGVEQTITNKEVDIEVPTLSVSDGLAKISNQSDNSFEFSPLQAGLEYTSKINNVTDTNVILASKDYVDENGGKIDKIKVNGTEQTITNKEVDISVPTKTSDITNDSNFQNETQVQAMIDAELTSVYKPGGTVEFASLPALTKENVGYIYDVTDSFTTTADFVEGAGKTYPEHTNVGIIDKGAAGYFYDVFSGMVDMSGYWSKSELVAITTAEIDEIMAA